MTNRITPEQPNKPDKNRIALNAKEDGTQINVDIFMQLGDIDSLLPKEQPSDPTNRSNDHERD
jgi:hypothetical protein